MDNGLTTFNMWILAIAVLLISFGVLDGHADSVPAPL